MTVKGLRYFFRSFLMVAAIAVMTVSLGSCQAVKNQLTLDRPTGKELQEYRDALAPQPLPPEEVSTPPDFRPVVAMPADMKLPSPLVTVSVNQTVSLRDLLFELSEQAGVDLELDPQIKGSIIFTAKDKPFSDVVDRICEMAGLRYKFENSVLRVEVDRPYIKSYKVDYINIARKSTSSIKSDLSVTSSENKDLNAGTSSNASISNSFDSTMWKELEDGLKQVLLSSDKTASLATTSDPVAMPVAPLLPNVNPDGAAITPPAINAPVPGAGALPPSNPGVPGGDATAAVVPPVQQAPVTVPPSLNIVQSSSSPAVANPPATYSISKETGVVHVFATEHQHRLVQKFFNDFRRVATVQILIEAKVLEVSLTDQFETGIDWNKFSLTGLAQVEADLTQPATTPPTLNFFKASFDLGHGIKPVVDALSRYGNVRALSSPRVTVMNNNPAVVNVTSNAVYFDIVSTTVPNGGVGGGFTTTKTATVKSAPEGVLMNVLPSANPDTGEILLAVRPTISKITKQVVDPVNAGNTVPQLSVQEIDSVVKIQSGQTLIMGGLMRDQNAADRAGIPLLGEVPLVGPLFRSHKDLVNKSELVILLRAQVVPGASNGADEIDRKIYNDFSQDRRPARI